MSNAEPSQDRLVRYTPGKMRLRIEEHFCVNDTVSSGMFKVVPGKSCEVRGIDKDTHAHVIVVSEKRAVSVGGGTGWRDRTYKKSSSQVKRLYLSTRAAGEAKATSLDGSVTPFFDATTWQPLG